MRASIVVGRDGCAVGDADAPRSWQMHPVRRGASGRGRVRGCVLGGGWHGTVEKEWEGVGRSGKREGKEGMDGRGKWISVQRTDWMLDIWWVTVDEEKHTCMYMFENQRHRRKSKVVA